MSDNCIYNRIVRELFQRNHFLNDIDDFIYALLLFFYQYSRKIQLTSKMTIYFNDNKPFFPQYTYVGKNRHQYKAQHSNGRVNAIARNKTDMQSRAFFVQKSESKGGWKGALWPLNQRAKMTTEIIIRNKWRHDRLNELDVW